MSVPPPTSNSDTTTQGDANMRNGKRVVSMKTFIITIVCVIFFAAAISSSADTQPKRGPAGPQGEQGVAGPQGPKGEKEREVRAASRAGPRP